MSHAVSCPSCGRASRVLPEGLGRAVACPHCGKPFIAGIAPAERRRANPVTAPPERRADGIPVVGRVRRDEYDGDPARVDPFEPAPPVEERSLAVVGLALVPLGIPLFWLVATLATGRTAIFSYAVPVSLALGLVGLGLGVCYAGRFSTGLRVRAVVALILVGYAAAALAYFTRPEWVVAMRRQFPAGGRWVETTARDGAYKIQFPPGVRTNTKSSPLADWPLAGSEVAPPGGKGDVFWGDRYTAAHGTTPADIFINRRGDDEWFAAARAALVDACGGEVTDERAFTLVQLPEELPAREYRVRLGNGTTHRVVRIIRNRRQAYYLAVEGEFLLTNLSEVAKLRDVRRYFESFQLLPKGGN